MKAAILLTCFNRKDETLACLDCIYRQDQVKDLNYSVYLVDDGSTDGTSKAVSEAFPEVKVLTGSGNLYWNRGMNLAWRTAIQENFDYYIWLNDDVSIDNNAFQVMFDSFFKGVADSGTEPVIVGCFKESGNGRHSYGGFSSKKSVLGIRTKRKLPGGSIESCDTFNGNLVLVPDSVVKKIGVLDDRYTHAFGDKDYGYRCRQNNIPMYITPAYVGECSRNDVGGSWLDPNASLRERYRRLKLPNGIPPAEYFYSYRKYSNSFAGSVAIIKLYVRLLFPRLWTHVSRSDSGE